MLEGVFDKAGRIAESNKEALDQADSVRRAVLLAWSKYAISAIKAYTTADFMEVAEGIIPGLLAALVIPIAGQFGGVILGSALGVIITAFTGQAEVIPVTAELGQAIGGLFASVALGYLGLRFLIEYIGPRIGAVGERVQKGVSLAWNAGAWKVQDGAHKREVAAQEIAEGIGIFWALVIIAILAFLAARGAGDRVGRLNRFKESYLSKVCPRIADWFVRNSRWLETRYKDGPSKIEGGARPPAETPTEAPSRMKTKTHGSTMPKVRSPEAILGGFQDDLEFMKHYLVNEAARYEELANRLGSSNKPESRGGKTIAQLRNEAKRSRKIAEKLLDPYAREMVGHMQSVEAGGDLCNPHLTAFRACGTPEAKIAFLQDRFEMSENQAKAVADKFNQIQGLIDLKGHDNTLRLRGKNTTARTGSKGSPQVAYPLSSNAKALTWVIQDTVARLKRQNRPMTDAEVKFKNLGDKVKNKEKLTEEELVLVAEVGLQHISEIPELRLLEAMEGELVETGRAAHSPSYFHHNPELPEDWVEWSIDTILARLQMRGYFKGKPPTMEWWTEQQMAGEARGDKMPADLVVGMLKFAKGVCYEFPLEYIHHPDANLPQLVH